MKSIDFHVRKPLVSSLPLLFLSVVTFSSQAATDLALGKDATASSRESSRMAASSAFDGNASSRWASSYRDDNWIAVDLGDSYRLTQVTLDWETAYGSDYDIQVSSDGKNWNTVYTETNGDGDEDIINLDAAGRYVRMKGNDRGTNWGYSLYAFEVYGQPLTSEGDTVALEQPASASSRESNGYDAEYAFDGDMSTRWASGREDDDWIAVDLGEPHNINEVTLHWETAYASEYDIQVSNDGASWQTLRSVNDSNGETDTLSVDGVGRYVRMQGHERATRWGYSLWEFEVKGSPLSESGNIAQGKPVSASSQEYDHSPSHIVDGDGSSRWASSRVDDNWIAIDLGKTYDLSGMNLHWETAYAAEYDIQVSDDGQNWTTAHSVANASGDLEEIELDASGRYVRLDLKDRGTQWGYSLWEVEVFGQSSDDSGDESDGGSDGGSDGEDSSSSSDSSSSAPSDGDDEAPAAPVNLSVMDVTDNSVTLTWNDNDEDVAAYVVYRNGSHLVEVDAPTDSYTDEGLKSGTLYTYKLRAADEDGNWSSDSSTLTVTTESQEDVAVEMTLEWIAPKARVNGDYLELDEIDSYEIRYSPAGSSGYEVVTVDSPQTTYTFELEGDYEFEIATVDTDGRYSDYVDISPRQ